MNIQINYIGIILLILIIVAAQIIVIITVPAIIYAAKKIKNFMHITTYKLLSGNKEI